jgi:hypothetical protein
VRKSGAEMGEIRGNRGDLNFNFYLLKHPRKAPCNTLVLRFESLRFRQNQARVIRHTGFFLGFSVHDKLTLAATQSR